MKKQILTTAVLTIVFFQLTGIQLRAQELDEAAKPVTLGNFATEGQASAGYRFTDIHGYHPQFLQLFDLKSGLRLQDFHLSGEAKDRGASFADSFWINANGLGGDPFPTAQIGAGKSGVYDFRMNWRQSYYYWNQNDNAILPIASSAGVSTGLTDNHDWSTVRKFGSADFTFHPTNDLRLNFDAFRTTNSGALLTTRSLDFFNSPSYWGSFARGNPYNLYAPLNDTTDWFAAGIDYTWHSWTGHYKTGYQSFGEDISLNNLIPGQLSIDPVAISRTEPLTQLSWTQTRRLTTPINELSYVGNPASRLEWRGSILYYRYRGPAALDQAFNGIAPGSTGALAPYSVAQSGRATVTAPSALVTQGFTYKVNKWLDWNTDYRYSRFTSSSTAALESLLNGATQTTGSDVSVWRNGVGELTADLVFTPLAKLTVTAGIRLTKNDLEAFDNGIIDPTRTQRSKVASPELRFGYQPAKALSIRGDMHSATSGASYTAITPHTQVSGRLVVRYQPIENLSLENSLLISDSKLTDSSYHNNIRSNSTIVNYAWSPRFSIFSGFSYDSFWATGQVIYPRGVAPLTDSLNDQEVNRVVQGGFQLQPAARFGIRFTGNYDRSTGVGQISGEPPAYGPMKWPLATATAFFDLPKAGRLSLDFQRTYYLEQIVTANNFSANLLTIRWTRGFFRE